MVEYQLRGMVLNGAVLDSAVEGVIKWELFTKSSEAIYQKTKLTLSTNQKKVFDDVLKLADAKENNSPGKSYMDCFMVHDNDIFTAQATIVPIEIDYQLTKTKSCITFEVMSLTKEQAHPTKAQPKYTIKDTAPMPRKHIEERLEDAVTDYYARHGKQPDSMTLSEELYLELWYNSRVYPEKSIKPIVIDKHVFISSWGNIPFYMSKQLHAPNDIIFGAVLKE